LLDARPEARVRIERDLRLHADEVLDERQRLDRRAPQQMLALERRAVELPRGEEVWRHAPILSSPTR
jgi:hypothetical protein